MNTKVNKVRTLSDVCWLSFHEYYNHYDYDKLFAPQIQQLTKCVPQLCFRKRGASSKQRNIQSQSFLQS